MEEPESASWAFAGELREYAVMDKADAITVPQGLLGRSRHAASRSSLSTTCWCSRATGKGEWLLVTGVSAGVGVAALLAGKALGAKVIGTSGSSEKLGL